MNATSRIVKTSTTRGSGRVAGLALLAALTAPAALEWAGAVPEARADAGDCSQPATSGPTPVATDCLLILQVAVAVATCDPDPCICAPGGQLPVAATDALVCLQFVTGLGVSLNCPCTVDCEDTQAPTCGGSCTDGGVCAPDPFTPSECNCLNDCEQGPAPQCNGDCEDVGSVCQPLEISIGGGASEDACACVPEGVTSCEDSAAPGCFGACAPGSVCENDGGSCTCTVLPLQGACQAALAPGCGGTCPDGFLCEDGGGGCACAAYVGQPETCFGEQGPTCGGACAFGDRCAVGIGGFDCECLEPCELSTAPSCGGNCSDPGESCALFDITVNGSTLLYCGCVLE